MILFLSLIHHSPHIITFTASYRPQLHRSAQHYRGPAVLDPLYPKIQNIVGESSPSRLTTQSAPNLQLLGSPTDRLSSVNGTAGMFNFPSNRFAG